MKDFDDKLLLYFVDFTTHNSTKFNNNNIEDHITNTNIRLKN